jgi:hypothetical protein
MPRRQLQADLADYAERIQTDHGWTATKAEHAAHLARMVDAYIVDTDLYRELAAVRAAASREREGFLFEIAKLRAQLAGAQQQVVHPGTSGIAMGLSIEVAP